MMGNLVLSLLVLLRLYYDSTRDPRNYCGLAGYATGADGTSGVYWGQRAWRTTEESLPSLSVWVPSSLIFTRAFHHHSHVCIDTISYSLPLLYFAFWEGV